MQVEFADISKDIGCYPSITVSLAYDTLAYSKQLSYRELALYVLENPEEAIRECWEILKQKGGG